MELIRLVVEKGHAIRKEKNIAVRQPLNSIMVKSADTCDEELFELLKTELNVKNVLWEKGKELKVELDLTITPQLLEEAKTRELIRKIQNERKLLGVNLSDHITVTTEWLPDNDELLELIRRKTLTDNLDTGNKFEVRKT